jgi:hypothetical protein
MRRLDGRLQVGQLVVDGLVGRDVDVAHPRVNGDSIGPSEASRMGISTGRSYH